MQLAEFSRAEDVTMDQLEEAIGIISSMLQQHCDVDEFGIYHSGNIAANAEAMEFLEDCGRFIIVNDQGRTVVGRFVEQ
jgi:hypothetical protein